MLVFDVGGGGGVGKESTLKNEPRTSSFFEGGGGAWLAKHPNNLCMVKSVSVST
jgi:hypothetical protein